MKAKNDSLIAENLHTDKKEDEEEGEGEELEKEEVALGREKMSRIQSMFSGEKKQVDEEGEQGCGGWECRGWNMAAVLALAGRGKGGEVLEELRGE